VRIVVADDVEKLTRFDFAKTASRQEALLTIFPSLLDIFYHLIFDFFQKNTVVLDISYRLHGRPPHRRANPHEILMLRLCFLDAHMCTLRCRTPRRISAER
jgi:hypothetical protein